MTKRLIRRGSAVRPNQPARRVIATFDNYTDDEAAVEYLADVSSRGSGWP